jgi:SAM-dependent methyltransferase
MARAEDQGYRGYVGPAEMYDLMGSSQFSLLCTLGLRENHRLLDIGCGSLRGGRLFIPYLAPGGYTGLEPNKWLVDEAIERQIGHDVLGLKAPTFVHNESFDLSGLDPFDFVIAQSIASHTGPAMTRALMEAIREGLAASGVAAMSIRHDSSDWTEEGWFYWAGTGHRTGEVGYRPKTVAAWLDAAGLQGAPIAWFHPRLTWWVIVRKGAQLPPHLLRLHARGAMLPFRQSWDLAYRLRVAGVRALKSGRWRK